MQTDAPGDVGQFSVVGSLPYFLRVYMREIAHAIRYDKESVRVRRDTYERGRDQSEIVAIFTCAGWSCAG